MPPKENSAAEPVRDNQAGRFVLRAPRGRNIQRSFNASWPATATCLLRASLTTSPVERARTRDACERSVASAAGDGSLAFTVVCGRSPLAIERVVEVSGDCHEDTLSYDQHDQLMMKARLDS
jgi:hypothetical protein